MNDSKEHCSHSLTVKSTEILLTELTALTDHFKAQESTEEHNYVDKIIEHLQAIGSIHKQMNQVMDDYELKFTKVMQGYVQLLEQ